MARDEEDAELATLRIAFTLPESRVEQFEGLARDMGTAATTVGKAISVEVVGLPQAGDNLRRLVILRFDSQVSLNAWRGTAEAATWRARLENVAIDKPSLETRKGVEIWFSSSSARYADPPAGWKTALLSIVGLYPTVMVLNALLAPLRGSLPGWFDALLSTCILSALITWPIMPLLTRIFHGWLYPAELGS